MVLITGASGFIGRALLARLVADRDSVGASAGVVVASRGEARHWPSAVRCVSVGGLHATTDWAQALSGVDAVVHLAAKVHVTAPSPGHNANDWFAVNVDATLNLARQAALAGVKRFVFISTIKVNGDATLSGQAFLATNAPKPSDAYGLSKLQAEQGLHRIAQEAGMELVVIRPPLVYGPGVAANFQAMMRWLVRGWPLPLAGVTRNRRSLVSLANLVDLIAVCLKHPAAAGQTFLVSDGEDLSTAELLRRMGHALGRPARLFTMPAVCLTIGAGLLGKEAALHRLCGSLQVDMTATQTRLGWRPPVSVDQALGQTAKGFKW